MAIQQKEVTVKGTTYLLTQFPTLRGQRLLKKLLKVLGPGFVSLQAGKGIEDAFKSFIEAMDEDSDLLITELVSSASKGGVALSYDMEFAGEYDKLYLLAKESFMFNYGSVFTMLGSDVA